MNETPEPVSRHSVRRVVAGALEPHWLAFISLLSIVVAVASNWRDPIWAFAYFGSGMTAHTFFYVVKEIRWHALHPKGEQELEH